mmetsp:Transcript_20016/g.57464  ORF Transcript_20016/g.57464 Transcript_20016/m.57464 type:complete len:233 (-) Transcript_20016:372-1070(-)
MVSTNCLNCSFDIFSSAVFSSPSLLPPPPDIAAIVALFPLGIRLSIAFSRSESLANNFLMSVLLKASVSRRSVTSTSRSPRTMAALSANPSRMAITNSSPALKPSSSSLEYMDLMASPTIFAPALITRSLTANGLPFFAIAAAAPSSPPAAAAGPSAILAAIAALCVDSLGEVPPAVPVLALVEPPSSPPFGMARDIRFRSSSTKTALGRTSFTRTPANSALDSDMCAVPRM